MPKLSEHAKDVSATPFLSAGTLDLDGTARTHNPGPA